MTLLSVVQDACREVSLPVPQSVSGNSNTVAARMLRSANATGKELYKKHKWQRLIKEGTITLSTSIFTYSLPADYGWIIPDTMWDRTNDRRVIFAVTPEEWQWLKGSDAVPGLQWRCAIRTNVFTFDTTPTSSDNGTSIKYDYVSKHWVNDTDSAGKEAYTADTDVSLIDEEIITLGTIYRYKKSKGLSWEADFMEFERQVSAARSNDAGARSINLSEHVFNVQGLNIPDRGYGS